jgi:RNA polymerase sigma factor (sigma-70 family)
MKKHRKQLVNVQGEKRLVDVPADDELYKADNREEYQRTRSKAKHVSLDEIVLADITADVIEAYEEAQLLKCLHEALQTLTEQDRQLIQHIYCDCLTEREAAPILGISQQAVTKRKRKIVQKLRNSLIDWL